MANRFKAYRDRRNSVKTAASGSSGKPTQGSGVENLPESLPRKWKFAELNHLPLPDLLWFHPQCCDDEDLLAEILDLAFLGRQVGGELDDALECRAVPTTRWKPAYFSDDLFLKDFAETCLRVTRNGGERPVQRQFLVRVLSNPPCDLETINLRQNILRELETNAEIRRRTEDLHESLHHFLKLFRSLRADARLNHAAFRLEILRQARDVIDRMVGDFQHCRSELRRIHDSGRAIQQRQAFHLMTSIIEYERHSATIEVALRIGANGKPRGVTIRGIDENNSNRFHRSPAKRWLDILRLAWHRGSVDPQMIVDDIVFQVYIAIAPALRSLLKMLGHLDFYLASFGFSELCEKRGLETTLADVALDHSLCLTNLFNPLLFRTVDNPMPCSLNFASPRSVTLITGPNSGGKTRLLQAVGLAQLLGQSGLHIPCSAATLPVLEGLYVSLVDHADVDEPEGRLGVELLRIRNLFQSAPRRCLVLLDELCTGTNPSEAIEIVTMVLKLLDQIDPVAFVTTHYLDFARQLQHLPPISSLDFLQVEVDREQQSTFQFVPGVAETSLAAQTAHRLGVTFEQLADLITPGETRNSSMTQAPPFA
jgi:DNA mismatch repair protein MutS2